MLPAGSALWYTDTTVSRSNAHRTSQRNETVNDQHHPIKPIKEKSNGGRTSRRQFLQTTGAATVAAAVAPSILADDKTGGKLPVIGPAGYRYEVHHNCITAPEHIPWTVAQGIAIDREGLIYIKHRTTTPEPLDAIVVFDPDWKYVRSFGKEFHSGGHGIDIRNEAGEEFLYLCDTKGHIAKMTLRGEMVWHKDAPKEFKQYDKAKPFRLDGTTRSEHGKVFCPTNIAFAPDGGFYVADGYGSNYIIRYDKDANPMAIWGGFGSEPGKMKTPHSVWLDDRPGREPALVVADRANARLQYFAFDGKHLGFVEDMLFPADFDLRGDVMLVPDLHARVTLLDRDNQVLAQLGDDPEWREQVLADGLKMRNQPERWLPGKFVHPHDACFDAQGNIYVAEWVTVGRISFLRHVG